ncbi:MAG: nucleotidyltransferase domain-containing protein [Candidatus Diapherotrites archaeon]|nr:nucleotidyltransferase domain-containing protein [Candidatus Diapherotrites archaeon]
MSIIKEFRKFVGFRILEYFIAHPSEEIHLKKLARKLNVSPGSVKRYGDLYSKENLLCSERKGNLRVFRLNNENFVVKELKRAYYAARLKEAGIEKVCKNCISVAVYGSFASGEFDEKSDLDIIIIGDRRGVNYRAISQIERSVNRTVQLTVLPFYRWKKLKKKKDPFAENVVKKHLLIRGAPL